MYLKHMLFSICAILHSHSELSGTSLHLTLAMLKNDGNMIRPYIAPRIACSKSRVKGDTFLSGP